jgi:hypothetical protein
MSSIEVTTSIVDDWRRARVLINDRAVVWRRKGNRLLVYEFEVGGFYLLNSSAMLIFEQIGGQETLGEIADRVEKMTNGAVTGYDVFDLVIELHKLNVVSVAVLEPSAS